MTFDNIEKYQTFENNTNLVSKSMTPIPMDVANPSPMDITIPTKSTEPDTMNQCKNIDGYLLMKNTSNKSFNIDNQFNSLNDSISNCNDLSFEQCKGVSYNVLTKSPLKTGYFNADNNKPSDLVISKNNECYYDRKTFNDIQDTFADLIKDTYRDIAIIANKYNLPDYICDIDKNDKNNKNNEIKKYLIILIKQINSVINTKHNQNDKNNNNCKITDDYYKDNSSTYNVDNDVGNNFNNIDNLLNNENTNNTDNNNIDNNNDTDINNVINNTNKHTYRILICVLISIYNGIQNNEKKYLIYNDKDFWSFLITKNTTETLWAKIISDINKINIEARDNKQPYVQKKITFDEIQQYNKIIKKDCNSIRKNDLSFILDYKNTIIKNMNINKKSSIKKITDLNNEISNFKSTIKDKEQKIKDKQQKIKDLNLNIVRRNATEGFIIHDNKEHFENKNNTKIDKKLIYNILIIIVLILFIIFI